MDPARHPLPPVRASRGPRAASVGAIAMLGAVTAAGCGSTSGRALPPAPEPAVSPPATTRPAGRVVHVGNGPEGVVVDPRTGLVAVAVRRPDGLALVDGARGRVVRRVLLPASARHLSLAGPGGPVLVPAEHADALFQVALPSGRIVARTPVGRNPHDATQVGDRVLVSDELGGKVSVVRAGRVERTLGGFVQPAGVVASQGRVGVVDVRGNFLAAYDAGTLRRVGRVPAGAGPTHAVAGGSGPLEVIDTRGSAVLTYRLRPTVALLQRLSVGGTPYGVAIDPRRHRLWVTLTARNRVVAYRLSAGGPAGRLASLPTVRQPNTVAVDPASGRVYVASETDGTLQILPAGSGGR